MFYTLPGLSLREYLLLSGLGNFRAAAFRQVLEKHHQVRIPDQGDFLVEDPKESPRCLAIKMLVFDLGVC